MTALGLGGGVPTSIAALAQMGVQPSAGLFASDANTRVIRNALSRLVTGDGGSVRIAFVGNSKTLGAGASSAPATGTTPFTADTLTKARPYRVGQALKRAGVPVVFDTFFGAAEMAAIADVLAYDPRRSGFAGWDLGGQTSLGGRVLRAVAGVNGAGNFQPSQPVDRVSVFHIVGGTQSTIRVAKGSESFTINANGSVAFVRSEIVFTAKTAEPIIITREGAGQISIAGIVAWDGAAPGVEICNLGRYGTTMVQNSAAADPWSPLNALGVMAPHLTCINTGSADITSGNTMTDYLTAVGQIVDRAKISGSVIIEWPSVGGVSPTNGGADAIRAVWRAELRKLAIAKGCGYLDEEALLGGRAQGAADGAFRDGLHEMAWAYDREARALAPMILPF